MSPSLFSRALARIGESTTEAELAQIELWLRLRPDGLSADELSTLARAAELRRLAIRFNPKPKESTR